MSLPTILHSAGAAHVGGNAGMELDRSEPVHPSHAQTPSGEGHRYSEVAEEISARHPSHHAPVATRQSHPAPAVYIHYPNATPATTISHPFVYQAPAPSLLPNNGSEEANAEGEEGEPAEIQEFLTAAAALIAVPAGSAGKSTPGSSKTGATTGGAAGAAEGETADASTLLIDAVAAIATGQPGNNSGSDPGDQTGQTATAQPEPPISSGLLLEPGFAPVVKGKDQRVSMADPVSDPPTPTASDEHSATDPAVNNTLPPTPASAPSTILAATPIAAMPLRALANPRSTDTKSFALPAGFKAAKPESSDAPLPHTPDPLRSPEETPPPKAPTVPPENPSGTGVATNASSMKFGVEMNDFAGSGLQELPPGASVTVTASSPGVSGGATKTALPVEFTDTRNVAFEWLVSNSKSAPTSSSTNSATLSAAGQESLQQVERMIGREVTMVRQSGAQSLAVSLKVDSQTSLFLQLTQHNGQIEASVRCERGDMSALAGHWSQLQEALSRQNVQLQPLDNPEVSPRYASDSRSENADAGDRQSNDSAQPQLGPEGKNLSHATSGAVSPKSKRKTQPHHGWEKWA